MVRAVVVSLSILILGCPARRSVDPEQAAATFDRIALDTGGVHGLSGLAVDGDGALWAVAERGRTAFRIELDGATARAVAPVPIPDAPAGQDLEAIAWSAGRFWVGTESKDAGVARVQELRLAPDRGRFELGATVTIEGASLGVDLGANHGVEGLCAVGDRVIAAIETVGTDARGRWAPLVVASAAGGPPAVHQVRLTTDTGKLSGLDCWPAGDRIELVAIERHFEVTKLLRFTLPAGPGEIAPTVALDLGPTLRGALNLEGIVRLPDGRVVMVVDNQYGKITGPDELVVVKPERLRLP